MVAHGSCCERERPIISGNREEILEARPRLSAHPDENDGRQERVVDDWVHRPERLGKEAIEALGDCILVFTCTPSESSRLGRLFDSAISLGSSCRLLCDALFGLCRRRCGSGGGGGGATLIGAAFVVPLCHYADANRSRRSETFLGDGLRVRILCKGYVPGRD